MSILVNEFLGNIDFNVTLMQGMLSFLLFAGAFMDSKTSGAFASIGVLVSSFVIGGGFWLISGAVGLSLPFWSVCCLESWSLQRIPLLCWAPAGSVAFKSKDCRLFNDGVAVLFSVRVFDSTSVRWLLMISFFAFWLGLRAGTCDRCLLNRDQVLLPERCCRARFIVARFCLGPAEG